jgi:hypothetical protein
MKRLLTTLAVILLAPLTAAPSFAVVDLATGLEAAPMVPIPLPGNTRSVQVLWDLTHGVYLGYEPAQYYSNLVATLDANGYQVSTTAAGVQNIDLSQYDVLVINVGSSYNTAYGSDEVAAIQTFVANGGGLLIMGDNPNVWPANINPVAQAFGVTVGVLNASGNVTTFIDDPLFTGVSQIYWAAGGSLGIADPSIAAAWTADGLPAISAYQPCRVVVTGDINWCDNTYGGNPDNPTFSLNVFSCLASGAPVPVVPTTWGRIKAANR